MRHLRVLALLALAMGFGCAGPERTFQVSVTNVGNEAVAVGLTKRAGGGARPAVEAGWAAPEDVATFQPDQTHRRWGTLVQPGETVTLGPLGGRFPQGVEAVLRVYQGDRTVDQLLAVSPKDRDRADVSLMPGPSAYVVSERSGRMVAVPREP